MIVFAMLLAHLVGDYVLQWDNLAQWKSKSTRGACVHGLIVLIVTVIFALPFSANWLPYALFIGMSHILIDAGQQWLKERDNCRHCIFSPLTRYLLDQAIHLGIIFIALSHSGALIWSAQLEATTTAWLNERYLKLMVWLCIFNNAGMDTH